MKDCIPDAIRRVDLTEKLSGYYILIDTEAITGGWIKRIGDEDTQYQAMAEILCGGETPYPVDAESLRNKWPSWKYGTMLKDCCAFVCALNSIVPPTANDNSAAVKFIKDNLLLALSDPDFLQAVKSLLAPRPLSDETMRHILSAVANKERLP